MSGRLLSGIHNQRTPFFYFSPFLDTYLDRLCYLIFLLLFSSFDLSNYTVIIYLGLLDAKPFDKYHRQIIKQSVRPSSTDNLELERLELDRINWNLAFVNRSLGTDALLSIAFGRKARQKLLQKRTYEFNEVRLNERDGLLHTTYN